MLNQKNLLVFNYCMDLDDPLLSHQVEAVNSLSIYFENVKVVTGRVGRYSVNRNVEVISSGWEKGKPIRSLFRFISCTIRVLTTMRDVVIFSHMTEVQSAVASIPLRILGIPHYLWYAHTYRSIYLRITHVFANGIITSTIGSCPIISMKVHAVGQAINQNDFRLNIRDYRSIRNFLHVGRFDQSKNISEIIETISALRNQITTNLTFTQIGSPTNVKSEEYCDSTRKKFSDAMIAGWLRISPSTKRSEIPTILTNYDAFIHAYMGSLDKSIIEATFVGLPVITINQEYLEIFGSWTKNTSMAISLESELRAILNMDPLDVKSEVIRRNKTAILRHSLDSWANQIYSVLTL